MTIVESTRNDFVKIKLEFLKALRRDPNTADFTFVPAGNHRTPVTWACSPENRIHGQGRCGGSS